MHTFCCRDSAGRRKPLDRRTGSTERAVILGCSGKLRRQHHCSAGQHAVAAGFAESPASSAATTLRRPDRTWRRRHPAVDVLRSGAHDEGVVSGFASGARTLRSSLWTLCNGTDLPLQRVPGCRHRHLVSYLLSLPLHRAFYRQLVVHVRAVKWRRAWSKRHLPQHNNWSMAQMCRRRYDQFHYDLFTAALVVLILPAAPAPWTYWCRSAVARW